MPTKNGTRHYFVKPKVTSKHVTRTCANCGVVEKLVNTGGARNGARLIFTRNKAVLAEGGQNLERPPCDNMLKRAREEKLAARKAKLNAKKASTKRPAKKTPAKKASTKRPAKKTAPKKTRKKAA